MYCSMVSGPNASFTSRSLLSLFTASSSSAARLGGLFGFSSNCWMMTLFSLFHQIRDTTILDEGPQFHKLSGNFRDRGHNSPICSLTFKFVHKTDRAGPNCLVWPQKTAFERGD